MLIDADSMPGPQLRERMVAARAGGSGVVVDARVLPVETTRVEEPKGEDGPNVNAPLRVSASCWLLSAEDLPAVAPLWNDPVGESRARLLGEWAQGAGRDVVVGPSATVFLPVRVDADGGLAGAVPAADPSPFQPPDNLHPAAQPATSLATVLSAAGLEPAHLPLDAADGRPFLSVVIRTQGTRSQCLEEVFMCLSAQTNRDFEVVLLCHRASVDAREDVRRIATSQPDWLQERVRLMDVERPGRSAPLNEGFAAARGRYIAILDDDDTVLGHWVETFSALERAGAGSRPQRSAALRQDVVPLVGHEPLTPVAVGNPFPAWSSTFDFVEHLQVNHSPCMSVAFPRGAFHDLGLRFDEALAANEDWEFLVRAAGLVGVVFSPEVTSVYRWWLTEASSRELHSTDEWDAARDRVLATIDATVLLLPLGAASRFREVTQAGWRKADENHAEAIALATSQHEIIAHLDETGRAHERALAAKHEARAEAKELRLKLKKRTARFEEWKVLMRRADELLEATGSRDQHGSAFEMTPPELESLIAALQNLPVRRRRGWTRGG